MSSQLAVSSGPHVIQCTVHLRNLKELPHGQQHLSQEALLEAVWLHRCCCISRNASCKEQASDILALQESSGDEAAQANERSNRQLEAAIMRQRLAALQQQQEQLQQQLATLPAEQQQLAQHHLQDLRVQLQQQHQQHGRGTRGRGRGSRCGGIIISSSRGRRQSASASASAAAADWAGAPPQDGPGTDAAGEAAAGGPSLNMALVETERDRLIRCGLLTPFDKVEGFDMRVQGGAAAAAAQAPHHHQQQQQQPDPQQQPAGGLQPLAADPTPAGLQPPPPQQQQQAAGSSRSQLGGAPDVVDEQWALLTRNAVQQGSEAAHHVPADLADIAHQVGRGGLSLSHLIAKTAQQAVEVGITSRPRAILMEAGEVGGHWRRGRKGCIALPCISCL